MSVYTPITKKQLSNFLKHYNVGQLINYTGIKNGVENTNYFVDTDQGRFVLTIYETLSKNDLPFFLNLMQHLTDRNIPIGNPIKMNNESLLSSIANKPATLNICLKGENIINPNKEQCAAFGEVIGKMHLASQSYKAKGCFEDNKENQIKKADSKEVFASLSEKDSQLLQQELEHYERFDGTMLPRSVIHSDLFKDNVLFDGESLSGIVDFYNARNDAMLYDLAVAVNDWCFDENNQLDMEKYNALVSSYNAIRPINQIEKDKWYSLLRIAALQFWAYRLIFNLYPHKGKIVNEKNSDEYKAKIKWYQPKQDMIQTTIKAIS